MADDDRTTARGRPLCAGHSKQTGKPCGKVAGYGTDHLGAGLCKFHGGSSPGGVRQAEQIVAERAVQQFGLPREVEPHQALIEELHRCAGWVAWLEIRVREEGPANLNQMGPFGPYESQWNQLLTRERAQLHAVAKSCISAGVEERRVRVLEESASFAAKAIRQTLTALGHDVDDPKVAEAVRGSLTVLDGGQAA